jgi:hypothetical protein
VEQLAHQCHQTERDRDGEQAHHQWQDRGQDRAEHHDQHQQGDHQADRLGLAHVLLGQVHEVGEQGRLTGHLHPVLTVPVLARHAAQVLDDGLGGLDDGHRDQRGHAIGRDQGVGLLHRVEAAVRGRRETRAAHPGHRFLDASHGLEELQVGGQGVGGVHQDVRLGRVGLGGALGGVRAVGLGGGACRAAGARARQLGQLLGREHLRVEHHRRRPGHGRRELTDHRRRVPPDLQHQQHAVLVGGEQHLLQRQGVGVGGDWPGDVLGAEGLHVGLQPLDEPGEPRTPGILLRAHHQELGVALTPAELRVDHVLGAHRFGVVRERDVVGQHAGQ